MVGISCRFPDAVTPAEYWRNLVAGRESIRELTDDDLRLAGQAPAVRARRDFVGRGVVLADVDKFDAAFFGINPREAEIIDPQQRLFLECAWEALEDTGYDPSREDSLIGVFGGADLPSYLFNLYNNPSLIASVGIFALAVANDKDHLTTRVAYKLNLRGPAVTVQTACSTSLVAVCQACQSLLHYQCDIALAGGVSIFVPQGGGYFWNQGGINSKDGHCRSYDASSDGTVGGSGAGIIVLKRYEDALASGDHIYSVIRGFGLSNDGGDKVGYTAPSVEGQARAISAALAMAGFDPDSIGYIEGHGTGTALGDPVEMAALNQVFRKQTARRQFCGLGSVKTNLGHLSVAAGIAGLIKTLLALQHKTLPPSLNYQHPNPSFDIENSPFYVVDRLRPWENAAGLRRAGVSSFGIGGTNAHVVLEEAPPVAESGSGRDWQLLPVAAKSLAALDQASVNLARRLGHQPDINLADVSWTLGVGRQAFEYRRVLLLQTGDVAGALAAWERNDPGYSISGTGPASRLPVVFLFPGQGSQYAGMSGELYRTEPIFRRHLDECHAILQDHTGFDFAGPLTQNAMIQTEIAQPALFATEYSLARLWIHWGVRPSAMAGHSIGEYVAACLAGVFSLQDALELVATRGRLMQSLPAGAMLGVPLREDELAGFLADGLSLAAVNGPSLAVLSGPIHAIERTEAELARRSVPSLRLHTSHAFHSSMMDPIVESFVEWVRQIPLREPILPYLSNLTGTWIKADQATDPAYWGQHLRQTVRFGQNLQALHDGSRRSLLEVGPGRVLSTLARQSAGGAGPLVLSSLPGAEDRTPASQTLMRAVAALWANGAGVDWRGFHCDERRRRVSLPTYPFERQRYWVSPAAPPAHSPRNQKNDITEWFYKPVWRRLAGPLAVAPPPASWVIVCGKNPQAARLASALRDRSCEATIVGSLAEMPPGSAPRHVVYWWDHAINSGDESTAGFFGLLSLGQAIADSSHSQPVDLVVVTSGSSKVSPLDRVAPENALLAGACKVIAQELPDVRTRFIDVSADEAMLPLLVSEMVSETGERQVALRNNGRWALGFEPVRLDAADTAGRFRRNGVYLITGGLGGIGLALAAHLASKWQAKLVLTSRLASRPTSEWGVEKIRCIQAMQDSDAELMIEGADVTDPSAMRELRWKIHQRLGEVNGILHCAGVAGGGMIQLKTVAQANGVMAAKVVGTQVLWDTFAGDPLDFFMMSSSVNALMGGFGQIDYAAANCYLDAFAEAHSAALFPVVSVNWDTWAEVGMAVKTEVPDDLKAQREVSLRNGITPAEGGLALEFALSANAPRIVVSTTSLQARIRDVQIQELAPIRAAAPVASLERHTRPNLPNLYVAPNDAAEQAIAGIWSELLGIDRIGAEDDFLACGGHSLLAIQLISRIREAFKVEISVAGFFEEPTVRGLAVRLRMAGSARAALTPRVRSGRLPLSHAQQRLWFLHRRDGTSATYNIAIAFRIQGELDQAALEAALADLVARHESLRTIFPDDEGVPYQCLLAADEAAVPLVKEESYESAIAERLAAGSATGIDVTREIPLRVWWFGLGARQHVLLIVLHHIAGDEWSLRPLARDLTQAYEARRQGQPPTFTPLPVQYADYSLWQRELLGEEGDAESLLSRQLNFWRQALAGAPEELRLPVDRPRPAVSSYRGGTVGVRISAEVHGRLLEIARSTGASLFMVLQAGLAALLARLGAGDDIPIGSPVAGRGERALEELIGFFVNTLVLRTDVSGDPDFVELVKRVRRFNLDAYGHQEVPFERVVEALAPGRALARHPLFQVMLALQNTAESELRMANLAARPEPLLIAAAKFDLTFILSERRGGQGEAGGIEGGVEYSEDLFHRETAEAIAGWYERLLGSASALPDERLHRLELISGAERRKLLEGWNGKRRARPQGTLAGLFEEQVRRNPQAAAVESGEERLSYGELNARANRVAWHLRASGLQRGGLAAIRLERGVEMVVAMLGVVKAGGGYLPLDLSYPPQRVAAMLAGSGAKLYDFAGVEAGEVSAENLDEWAGPGDLAYVMYTSGSTGAPKGIGIAQEAIVRLVRDSGYVRLQPGDRIAQAANASFDAATFEIWGALLNGGCVVILPRETTLSPDAMGRALRERKIDTLFLTTALFNQIAREAPQGFSGLRDLLFGGEAVDPGCVRAVLEAGAPQRLLHMYGPTENTTFSTWHLVEKAGEGTIPIGGPVGNTRIYVLDAWLEPVPVGVAGELYVAGVGLARGYQGQPGQTAERFVADPHGREAGARMYRTGDLVRWGAEGAIEFLGRVDQQVKIRGFRIEPGEIEAVLREQAGMEQAAVVVREDGPGGKQLVAYVKAAAGAMPEAGNLRRALSERLPDYMVPDLYVRLEEMPLTANGKLDRKAFPAPERGSSGYRAPRTPQEQILCDLFAELLKVDRVGLDDNFFRLGGDSIISIQLVSRARRAGLELAARDIFQQQTVENLALVARRRADTERPRWDLEAGTGEFRPTPIMRWFVEHGGRWERFSQSVLLRVGDLSQADFVKALQVLIETHDVLRMHVEDGSDWKLRIASRGSVHSEACVRRVEMAGLALEARQSRIQEAVEQAEARLDARAGRMIEAVFFNGGEADHLLLVIHHLAVDGVSWRILVSDLEAAWRAISRGEEPRLDAVGTPFRVWAERLEEAASSEALQAELPEWERILASGGQLIPAARMDSEQDTVASAGRLRQTLSSETTEALLKVVPAAFNAGINDVFLTALAVAVQRSILVDVEGHGREPMEGGLDLSRTVGWFTSLYPVSLEVSGGSISSALKQVKEQLRAVPGNGLGYGLLRYLDPDAGKRLQAYPEPQLGFNYLGRFGAEAAGELTGANEQISAAGADAGMPLAHLVEVNAAIAEGPQGPVLSATWTWAGRLLGEGEIRELADRWKQALETLVCEVKEGAGGHTPSDFPLVELSQRQVAEFEQACPEIEDVLPLSPLQEGLLFHALYDESAPDSYTVQFVLELEGHLDAVRMKAAAEALLARHRNLRAVIRHEGLRRPVQLISGSPYVEWREFDVSSPHEFITADRETRFDPTVGLLRFSLLKLARDRHLLVLTNHHLVLDGWSMPLLFGELLALYGHVTLPRVRPYRDYLDWLSKQDHEAALEMWREYLTGIEHSVRLAEGPLSKRPPERWERDVPPELTRRLQDLALDGGLTLNTLMQGLWAVLLGRLTGGEDVVFGITVSGRPAELAGVEQMVGLFINTLPLRVKLRAEDKLLDLCSAIQESQSALLEYQHTGLAEIQRTTGSSDLFDTLFVFENYPLDTATLTHPNDGLRVTGFTAHDTTHYPLTMVVMPGAKLHLRMDYATESFSGGGGASIGGCFYQLLEAAAERPGATVSQLKILGPEERRQVLEDFNPAALPFPQSTLPNLFEEQVARSEDAVAVVSSGKSLSYRELNQQANQLAQFLIARGACPESLVALCLDRSIEMIVAMMAVLKAGAAYLPLDADYPTERLRSMLNDSSPALVITTSALSTRLPEDARVVCLDRIAWGGETSDNPTDQTRNQPLRPDHPAYVIYTSGSTGKPKGVVVTHQNAARLFAATERWFDFGPHHVWTLFHSFAFDFSVWELWGALLYGGRVVVVPKAISRSPGEFLEMLADERVTVLSQTPSAFYQLIQAENEPSVTQKSLSLRYVVFGGEALDPKHLEEWYRRHDDTAPLLVNMYGITETTVHVTYQALDRELARKAQGSLIGGSIPDLRAYVLDASLEPRPIGVAGELYIAGAGLARGYLNRPALTAERFVADPHGVSAGARMYRTGDLARWRQDGTLEFLGRADQQVKIRGFRIELGEIEASLKAQPGVAQAAVLARSDGPSGHYLAAWIVPADGGMPDEADLRRGLSERLPDYMIPTAYVMLKSLPLTTNGKLDRKALPAPERRIEGYRGPRNKTEEILCNLFAETLRLERVGVGDNFFRLGGDSIVSIQLVSRARRAGLKFTPRDVFSQQTVEALAAVAVIAPRTENREDESAGIGEFDATPIMRWMWDRSGDLNRFSQSMALQVPAGLDEQRILEALQTLIDTHDVLRLRTEGTTRLRIEPRGAVRAEDCLTRIEREPAETRLDPAAGRVFEALWFAEKNLLRLVIHHLAVDGVSWRILLPDLEGALNRSRLDPVGTPFRTWARYLAQEACTPTTESELPVWESILRNGIPLLPGHLLDGARDTYVTAGHLHQTLDLKVTASLLTKVPSAFHAGINDVLLAALAHGIRRPILVDVEGHGREPMESGLDLSRTVGWLTSFYPISLQPSGGNIATTLKQVKEQLRAIPGKGLGYGLLRYMHPHMGARLKTFAGSQVGFNYLGRFGTGGATETRELGTGGDPDMSLAHLIEINAVTIDGPEGPVLSATWTWAGRHLNEHDVSEIADGWKRSLEALVLAVEKGEGGHTPSDFAFVDLIQEQVDALEDAHPDIEDILPLSPLQEGLLFHALYDADGPDVYTVQFVMELEGPVDAKRMHNAAEALLLRYPNLRSTIWGERLQVIPQGTHLDWHEESLPGVSSANEFLEKDRRKRFDVSKGLLRFALIKCDRNRSLLVSTNHHLLLDGWSMPLLFTELLALYGGQALPAVRPYRDYLGWLARQDKQAALDAWREHLNGIDSPTRIAAGATSGRAPERWEYHLPAELTAKLRDAARDRGLTLNTLIQGLWAVLLGRLTGRDDVVFGITVSGRPPELAGVEQMIGLFINALPLRVRLKPFAKLEDLWKSIQESQGALLDHQHIGLSEIQRAAGLEELFDTLLVFENYPMDASQVTQWVDGVRAVALTGHDATHYPLTLIVAPWKQLYLRLDYAPERIAGGRTIGERFARLLEAAAEHPEELLSRLDILAPQERRQLLSTFNAEESPLPQSSLQELFEAQASRTPDAIAVVCGEQSLSYADLNHHANQMAHHLIDRGVGPECLIGVCLKRSIEMVVALVAIVKAGAAYLPLDVQYPAQRLRYMLEDAAPTLVIGSDLLRAELPSHIETCSAELIRGSRGNARHADGDLQHAAYVIYTSGSTGRPKGIVQTQATLVNMLLWQEQAPCPGRVAQFTSISFDVSLQEIFSALLFGKTLVVLDSETRLDPEKYPGFIRTHAITDLFVPNIVLENLARATLEADCALPTLRNIYQAGEALTVTPVLRRFFERHPDCRLHNHYGPAETHVATTAALPSDTEKWPLAVPIGAAIWNTRVYVLDGGLQLAPIGVAGELYIAGAGLARGYLKRPALTSERFVADPYSGQAGARMYRTGDLARWRADGVLEFLGRADQQVKIRGFRVEPGEIEAALMALDPVRQAVVVVRDEGAGGKQLVAYLVIAPGAALDAAALREALGDRLPSWMIPSAFVTLDAIPLSPNKKVDRASLPSPRDPDREQFEPPSGAVEECIAKAWRSLLQVERIARDDDFFSLGGHSLLAMRVVSRMRQAFNVELSLPEVFAARTLRDLAVVIQALLISSGRSGSTPLSEVQEYEELEL